jgi:hypothetical protein
MCFLFRSAEVLHKGNIRVCVTVFQSVDYAIPVLGLYGWVGREVGVKGGKG